MFFYMNHRIVSEGYLRKMGIESGKELESGCYPVDFETGKEGLQEHQDAKEDIDLGVLDDDKFVMGYEFIDKPIDSYLEIVREKLSQVRAAKERGGISFYGVPIDTSQESQILLMGLNSAAQVDNTITMSFTSADGQPVTVDATTIQGIYAALFDHIRQCRSYQADLLQNSLMTATTTQELAAIDLEVGWPTGIYQ